MRAVPRDVRRPSGGCQLRGAAGKCDDEVEIERRFLRASEGAGVGRQSITSTGSDSQQDLEHQWLAVLGLFQNSANKHTHTHTKKSIAGGRPLDRPRT